MSDSDTQAVHERLERLEMLAEQTRKDTADVLVIARTIAGAMQQFDPANLPPMIRRMFGQ